MSLNANSKEVQEVLSLLLENPSLISSEAIKKLFPEIDLGKQSELFLSVRRVYENVLNFKTGQMGRGGPDLIHKLRFCWIVLKKADAIIKRKGKEYASSHTSLRQLRTLFDGIIPVKELQDCFLQQLCSSDKGILYDNLRRIIWWNLRRNRYKYVEIEDDKSIIVHFPYIVDTINKDIVKWCKTTEIAQIPNVVEEIENCVNNWLRYSCIEGENSPSDATEAVEIAAAFIKDNLLKNKIFIMPTTLDDATDKRIKELEAENSRYAEENRKLEETVSHLKDQLLPTKQDEISTQQVYDEIDQTSLRELQEFLKSIDSKYSFDALRSVQLGEDQSITMRNFIAHLFYCLRKKAFFSYPTNDEFDLEYEQSGLYQCLGFQVPAGGKVHVKVEKTGWAFKREDRIFPIRKAVLRLA
jgi:predicted nuclease with TOPRIM domain